MSQAGTTIAPIRPYSSPTRLAKLDGRTREAKLANETRAELVSHVGGTPSATQRALIERAVQLTIRVETMDRKFAETGIQTEHDSRTYLAWSASLSRVMRDLGLKAKGAEAPTLGSYLASRAASATAA